MVKSINEELIRQVVYDTVNWENYPSDVGFRRGQKDAAEAIRLYHARAVAPLVETVEALGAMPEGFCFCSQERVGDDSKEHEVECADVRKTLVPFQ